MNPQLHSDIIRQLNNDYALKQRGEWLRGGECPSCNKKELFTHAQEPWVLRCGRLNKCGAEFHVKDLYPDLFNNWSERHQQTPELPNAAADGYLRDGRGFDLAKLAGWYSQESFYDHKLKIGSATVRFPLPGIGYWERIIDQPHRFGKHKANFNGAYGGSWWQAPNSNLAVAKELWITEGIFDSIALLHHDIASVSALTCNNYPEKALNALAAECLAQNLRRPKLVWALDAGHAGETYTKKHVARSIAAGWEATAAQPPAGKRKLDWNELHQLERINKKTLDEAHHQGAILVAKSVHEKALLIYNHDGFHSFYLGFENRMYWFEIDLAKFAKAKEEFEKLSGGELSEIELRERAMLESHTLREIANCYFNALYYQENTLTDEHWYYIKVDFPHDGASIKNAFTASVLTAAGEFKKRLLSIAPGAIYTGNNAQLDRIMQRQLFNIKIVKTIDFIGYSKEHKTWVFNDVAISAGKKVELNDEDFFEVGNLAVKSLSKSPNLTINTDLKAYSTDWLKLVWQCYEYKGIAALAFWLGSLFAEQIRDSHESLPFIELVGEPGAGKSTLIEFMWRLCGRTDYEGFDPSKSTIAARARNFSQVANLPVVLIEGDRTDEDRSKQKGFDWDELKPLYNGRSVYSRGVKNGGNETYEPPFRGALVISQNASVQASEAIMQRICHIGFDLASHTQESKIAADELSKLDIDSLSGFIVKATQAEKAILTTFDERLKHHETALMKVPGVRNRRIVKNHAMLAALVDALPHILPISHAEISLTQAFIQDMTAERQESINQDHQTVQEFWDTYDFLNGDDTAPRLNHARKGDQLIAINLNHFVAVAADLRQQIPELSDLKKLLKTSRARKFLGIKSINSVINKDFNKTKGQAPHRPETVKCWVFEAAKGMQ